MKKHVLLWVIAALLVTMIAGCASNPATIPTTQAPASVPTTAPTTKPSEGTTAPEDMTAYYIEQVYGEQIGRYYTALAEGWEAYTYLENGMSALPSYYYDGDPMQNVGFSLVDLDQDGSLELVLGAILNAEQDPSVFEIWTVAAGKPVMLAQGRSDNRYTLQYVQQEQRWQIANQVENNIACRGNYYLKLQGGKLEVIEGVVFDAFADEENPWFRTQDLDWDISNDEHIDSETAASILDGNRALYTAPEYFPYASYEGGSSQQPTKLLKQQLYERAEALSERFGVEIRIPEQSQLAYSHYDAYALTDLEFVRSALDILEETLSLYPEGFFRQLGYGTVEKVRIELVGGLAVKDGVALDPGSINGFSQKQDTYHLLVLNGYFANTATLFHEFTHIIDARLEWDAQNRQDALFDELEWHKLQPEGFFYASSYVNVHEYLYGFLDSDYFSNGYSLTYPTEDRATMMELALANNPGDFAPGTGRRAKLQYYAECIRDSFDTTGWPAVTLWEQPLQ